MLSVRREAMEREGKAGVDWGKLKKGKATAKGPVDPTAQYQLKHFEATGFAQVQQYDQPQAVDLVGLAPGEIGDRRRVSRSGLAPGAEGAEGEGKDALGVPGSKTGKDRRTSRLGLITFVKPVTDISVYEGGTAAFECTVSDAEAVVTWLINDVPVPAHRAQALSVGKTRRLVLKDCLLTENKFNVTAVLDEITKSTGQLVVTEAPFEFVEPLKHVKVKLGSPCELQCTVNKLNVALQWFKDGQPITAIKETVAGGVHTLTLPTVQDKDKGTYTAKYADLQTEGQVDVLGMICRCSDAPFFS